MLTNEQIDEIGVRQVPYQFIYEYTSSMILVLSGLSAERLEDVADELETDVRVFLLDYKGQYLVDDHAYLVEMLRQWPTPWDAFDHVGLYDMHVAMIKRGELPPHPMPPRKGFFDIGLNGLTVAQFFLAWAWKRTRHAKWCLSGEAVGSQWSQEDAVCEGIRAAVSAARSLTYAQALMASGENKLGQKAL